MTGCNDIPFFQECWSNHICVRKFTFALSVIYHFLCLDCYFLHRIRLIDLFLDLTNIACRSYESFFDNACCCNLTKYPTKWRLRRCRWFWSNFFHFNFTWAVFTFSVFTSFVVLFELKWILKQNLRWISSFRLL